MISGSWGSVHPSGSVYPYDDNFGLRNSKKGFVISCERCGMGSYVSKNLLENEKSIIKLECPSCGASLGEQLSKML